MLLAGQLVALGLIGIGVALSTWHFSHPLGEVGLMLVLVNGAMGFSKILNWILDAKGDLDFLAFYMQWNPTIPKLIFIILQLTGFFWAWRQLSTQQRMNVGTALLSLYVALIIPLRILDSLIRQAVNTEQVWSQSWLGWTKPVVFVDGLMIILALLWWYTQHRKLSALQQQESNWVK